MADLLDRLKIAPASRCTIVRELGARGMATVHLAEHVKHLREVAAKVLCPERRSFYEVPYSALPRRSCWPQNLTLVERIDGPQHRSLD